MKVVGRKDYSMVKDGVTYNGVTVHCLEPAVPPAVGSLCVHLSVGTNKPGYLVASTLEPGMEVVPVYNRFGKVEDLIVKK